MKRVVFVCVENANRSQMAEAFARIHGGAPVEAFSAGSRPSGRVNPKAVDAMREVGYDLTAHHSARRRCSQMGLPMREVGYDLTAHHSKSLQDLAGVDFDVAVTMGCGDECPFIRAKRREDWNIPDPKALPPEEFRAVRDLIEGKVKDLLVRLSQAGAK